MRTFADPETLPSLHAVPRVTFSIDIAKQHHKFSAAHFLIFDDGTAERLHGHNYQVAVQIAASDARNGLVADFKRIKPAVSAILERLDERMLVPGDHPELSCKPSADGSVEIRYRDRRYVMPAADVVVLPITNTSSENLAAWIADALVQALRSLLPDLHPSTIEVSVEETAGQRGAVRLDFSSSERLAVA